MTLGLPPWRRRPRRADLLFLLPLTLALFTYGAVRAPARIAVIALSLVAAGIALPHLEAGRRRALILPLASVALVALIGALPWPESAWPELLVRWRAELAATAPLPVRWGSRAVDPLGGLRTLVMASIPVSMCAAAYVAARGGGHVRTWVLLVLLGAAAALTGELHLRLGAETIFGGRAPAQPGFASAPFVNPNHLASTMAVMLPLALGLLTWTPDRLRDARLRPVWLPAVALVCLLLLKAGMDAGSRGFYLSAAVGLFVFGAAHLHRFRPRMAWGAMAAAGVAGGAALALGPVRSLLLRRVSEQAGESPLLSKVELWREAGRMFVDAPLLGWGLGSFRPAHRRLTPPWSWTDAPFAENELLQWLAEAGLIGCGLLMLACGFTVLRLRGPREFDPALPAAAGALAALGTGGMVDFLTRTGFGLALFGVLAGTWLGTGLRPPAETRKPEQRTGRPGFGAADEPRASRKPVLPRGSVGVLLTGAGAAGLLMWSGLLGALSAGAPPGPMSPVLERLSHAHAEHRDRVARAIAAGERRDADLRLIDELAAVAARFPWSDEPWVDLSAAYRRVGRWDESVTAARTARVNAPGDPRPALMEARSLRNAGDRAGAVRAYRAALASWPDDPSRLMEELRSYGLTAADLRPLPAKPSCGALRGLIEELYGSGEAGPAEWSEAAAMIGEAMDRCPRGSLAYCMSFARAARKAGAPDWGLQWSRDCLTDRGLTEQDHPEPAANLALLDQAGGLELYRQVIRRNPSLEASLGYGRLLLKSGAAAEAADHLEQIRRRFPSEPDLQRLWARAMVDAGRNALFLKQLDELDPAMAAHPALVEQRRRAERALAP